MFCPGAGCHRGRRNSSQLQKCTWGRRIRSTSALLYDGRSSAAPPRHGHPRRSSPARRADQGQLQRQGIFHRRVRQGRLGLRGHGRPGRLGHPALRPVLLEDQGHPLRERARHREGSARVHRRRLPAGLLSLRSRALGHGALRPRLRLGRGSRSRDPHPITGRPRDYSDRVDAGRFQVREPPSRLLLRSHGG